MTLGEYIAEYRSESKESLRSFAKRAGLSPTYVSYLEKGETQRGNKPAASIDTYRAIAKATGITLDEIIKRVDDEVTVDKDIVNTLQFFSRPQEISPSRQALLDAVDDMNEEQLKKLLQIIEAVKGM